MSNKPLDPDARPIIPSAYRYKEAEETNAQITLQSLTHEVLRDIARNESTPRTWRKAAIKFLMTRNHRYQFHDDYRELRSEILEEQQAEKEVKAVVESAVEGPID